MDHNGLFEQPAEIACALGDYRGAKLYFAEAMKVATETQTLTALLKVLVNLAILFAKHFLKPEGSRGSRHNPMITEWGAGDNDFAANGRIFGVNGRGKAILRNEDGHPCLCRDGRNVSRIPEVPKAFG